MQAIQSGGVRLNTSPFVGRRVPLRTTCMGYGSSTKTISRYQRTHSGYPRVCVRAEGEGSSGSSSSSSVSGSSLLGGAPRSGSSLLGGTPTPSSTNTKDAKSDSNKQSGSSTSASGSSLLGAAPPAGLGGMPSRTSSSSVSKVDIKDVELKSGVGVNYTALRDLLAEQKWREAEDETRAKLIEAAGPGAQERNWVYWSEVSKIPVEDMTTLDALWSAASNGKFGYRVQRQMWIQNRRQWIRFFRAIDWVQGENDVYRKWPQEFKYEADAPKGHLPLTNALRGTRLFEAILEHPAFSAK